MKALTGLSPLVPSRLLLHVLIRAYRCTLGAVAADMIEYRKAGYPDFTFGGLLGLFGRKDMTPALQERIARDVREILNEPDVRKRLTNLGLLIRGTTPAEFRTEQRAKWAALARAHGIKPRGQ